MASRCVESPTMTLDRETSPLSYRVQLVPGYRRADYPVTNKFDAFTMHFRARAAGSINHPMCQLRVSFVNCLTDSDFYRRLATYVCGWSACHSTASRLRRPRARSRCAAVVFAVR